MQLTQPRPHLAHRFFTVLRHEQHFVSDEQSRSWKRDLAMLAILLAVGVGLKLWLLNHTEALARDGIIYITYAARLGSEPTLDVLKSSHQHPLYPCFVLGMSRIVAAVQGELNPLAWQLSAQLANIVASWLMLIPLYFFGKELGSWKVGFWTALIYQSLPVVARSTADGVGEGTYLLFSALALWSAACGFRTQAWGWFALAGVGTGLAYLTRPEGALVAPVILLMLILAKVRGRWQASWRRLLACGCALGLAVLVVVSPYWWAIGGLTNKPSAEALFQTTQASTAPTLLLATRFADGEENGPWYAFWQVLDETSKSLLYGIWGLTIVAMLGYGRYCLRKPGVGLMFFLILVHVAVLWRLAVVRHYVSERHTVLIDLCSVCFAAYMWMHWESLWSRYHEAKGATRARATSEMPHASVAPALVAGRSIGRRSILRWVPHPAYIMGLGALIICIWGTTQTLKPLHVKRIPLREAGLWLAEHAGPADQIVDPHGYPRFLANQDPRLGTHPRASQPGQGRFVVVDFDEDDRERAEIIRQALAESQRNELVFAYPEGDRPKVAVYRAGLTR